jgi:hypothetical protein
MILVYKECSVRRDCRSLSWFFVTLSKRIRTYLKLHKEVKDMKVGELIQDSSTYGWSVKTARYVSEEKVVLEFEKRLDGRQYHIYVVAGYDGVVLQGYNFFEDNVPVDAKTWDGRVR